MGNIDLKSKVRDLLKKKKAIMLAHNYQRPEVQDTADLCGDSLELSIKAAQTDAEVIVFCGVHFMAETASMQNTPHCIRKREYISGTATALFTICSPQKSFSWIFGNYSFPITGFSLDIKSVTGL